ncbi:MAG: UBA/THIF-type NAD/FAD binding protein [Desulfonauticus sp. 38_4375]|nr:MAG: UBA/THIF-type NAD/FAD binding protein [Desulfonauticus sp. 38_4375]
MSKVNFLAWENLASLLEKSSFSSLLKQNLLPLGLKKNFKALSIEEQKKLLQSKVLVVGCGGLGGYVLELLARSGVGKLVFADGDTFEETNLNRQLFSTLKNLGQNKALEAKKRLQTIFPFLQLTPLDYFLTEQDLETQISQVDLVIDCLGGIGFKPVLIQKCQQKNIPIVTGAIAGFEGFLSTVLPESKAPLAFYQGSQEEGAENTLGSPASMVSLIATLQSAEAISFLRKQKFHLVNKVFYVSLTDFIFETYSL